MLNGFEGIAETPFGEFVRENVIKHLTNYPNLFKGGKLFLDMDRLFYIKNVTKKIRND